jgi:hypothetical protein
MIAIITLLSVIALSILVVRVGTIALTMTGLSEEVASFQALSAFSGVGFTTGEAEHAISTPGRRRVIRWLMRLGSAGLVTAIATVIFSFTGPQEQYPVRLVVLLVGLVVLTQLSKSAWFHRLLTPAIKRFLASRAVLDLRDYADLLHLGGGYKVAEVDVEEGDWLACERMGQLKLFQEGVLVLGIVRQEGEYIGAPSPALPIRPGDRVILYGKSSQLEELNERTCREWQAHEEAIAERAEELAEQEEQLHEQGPEEDQTAAAGRPPEGSG